MTVFVAANPDVGPGGRDYERANPLQDARLLHHFAAGTDVLEPPAAPPPRYSRPAVIDVPQTRRASCCLRLRDETVALRLLASRSFGLQGDHFTAAVCGSVPIFLSQP